MTIYLAPEVASGLGEDTFWTWFKREVPESEFLTQDSKIKYNDVILRYSTMGKSPYPQNTICLLWELYPEMKKLLKSDMWDSRIDKINESIKSSKKLVVSSKIMVEYYKDSGNIDILPIGVNTELYKPLNKKEILRKKYNIPLNKEVGVWAGTTHEMKGFDKLKKYKEEHPELFWIIIWKWEREADPINDNDCLNFIQIPQEQMNELYNCADFYLSTSRLRPFFMAEWEALASNLKFKILDNIQKDFLPSENPREQVFAMGWDRQTTKEKWLEYINNFIREKTLKDKILFDLNNYKYYLNLNLPLRLLRKLKNILKGFIKKFLLLWPIYRKLQSVENLILNRSNQTQVKIDAIKNQIEQISRQLEEVLTKINKQD